MDALNRKEAIIMGDDITPVTREEYCLKELAAGGSGSLDYVVPEQTVTFTEQTPTPTLQNVDASSLSDNDKVIGKAIRNGLVMYSIGNYYADDMEISFNDSGMGTIDVSTGTWYVLDLPADTSITISVIKGF